MKGDVSIIPCFRGRPVIFLEKEKGNLCTDRLFRNTPDIHWHCFNTDYSAEYMKGFKVMKAEP